MPRLNNLYFVLLAPVILLMAWPLQAQTSRSDTCANLLDSMTSKEEQVFAERLLKQLGTSQVYRYQDFLIIDKGQAGIEILSEVKLPQPNHIRALSIDSTGIQMVAQHNKATWFTTIHGRQVYMRRNYYNPDRKRGNPTIGKHWDLALQGEGFRTITQNSEGERETSGFQPLEGADDTFSYEDQSGSSVVVETKEDQLSRLYLPLIPAIREMITPDTRIIGTYRAHYRKEGERTYTVFLDLENETHGRFTITPVRGGTLVE